MEEKEEDVRTEDVFELDAELGPVGILRSDKSTLFKSEPGWAAVCAYLRDEWGVGSAFVCWVFGVLALGIKGWRAGWRMKVVLGFVDAFVANGGGDFCKLSRDGEDGCGMKEGIVPPRLVGGVTNAFISPAGLGGDARVKWADLAIVGRGMEDGEIGRGFTDAADVGRVMVAIGLSGVVSGRPKLKGPVAASSSSSSSSSIGALEKTGFELGGVETASAAGIGASSTASSAGVKVILMP
jgi:hypothetical protein